MECNVYADKSEALALETVQIEGEDDEETKSLVNPNSSELKTSYENEEKSTETQINNQNIPEKSTTSGKFKKFLAELKHT